MAPENDLAGISREEYGEHYCEHVIEIYKIYVEMADKISERRQSANSFFLTLNSALIAFVGYANYSQGLTPAASPFFWLVALSGMVLSFLWYRLIWSYKNINWGKFKIIHAMEQQLPLRPYEAEWTILGKGENPKLYWEFTRLEIYIPWMFFVLHLFVFIKNIF